MADYLMLRLYSFGITAVAIVFIYLFLKSKAAEHIGAINKRFRRDKSKWQYSPLRIIKSVKGDYAQFERSLMESSLILLILGKRGSGKSALALRLVENINANNGRKIYAMGINSKLPSRIVKVDDIKDTPPGSIVVIDEGGILLSSRLSMGNVNKKISQMMAISRHKDLSLFFISQNSGMIDLNVLRLVDGILFKEPGLLQKGFERNQIKKISEKAEKIFGEAEGDKRELVYVLSDHYEGLNKAELPSFWNEKISKSWR